MELVLSQQSSMSSNLTPETPITDPFAMAHDPPDLNPHIPISTPGPLTQPPAAQPEASTSATTFVEHNAQEEEDQVKVKQKSWKPDTCYAKALKFHQLKIVVLEGVSTK